MAGDLEDFLRRAAQRRQQKAAQGGAAQPQRQPPPQYTDRRTERQVRPQDEEVVMAEVVEDPREIDRSRQRKKVDQAKKLAARARAEAASRQRKKEAQSRSREESESRSVPSKKQSSNPSSDTGTPDLSGNLAQELIALIKQPGGIQKAILLREILDRPEHRW